MEETDQVLELVASYFRMLSEPTRLKVVRCICTEEKSVSDIVSETGLSQTNVSRQLNLLYSAGLLSRRRDGLNVIYCVADDSLVELCRSVSVRIAGRMGDAMPLRETMMTLYPAKRAARRAGKTK